MTRKEWLAEYEKFMKTASEIEGQRNSYQLAKEGIIEEGGKLKKYSPGEASMIANSRLQTLKESIKKRYAELEAQHISLSQSFNDLPKKTKREFVNNGYTKNLGILVPGYTSALEVSRVSIDDSYIGSIAKVKKKEQIEPDPFSKKTTVSASNNPLDQANQVKKEKNADADRYKNAVVDFLADAPKAKKNLSDKFQSSSTQKKKEWQAKHKVFVEGFKLLTHARENSLDTSVLTDLEKGLLDNPELLSKLGEELLESAEKLGKTSKNKLASDMNQVKAYQKKIADETADITDLLKQSNKQDDKPKTTMKEVSDKFDKLSSAAQKGFQHKKDKMQEFITDKRDNFLEKISSATTKAKKQKAQEWQDKYKQVNKDFQTLQNAHNIKNDPKMGEDFLSTQEKEILQNPQQVMESAIELMESAEDSYQTGSSMETLKTKMQQMSEFFADNPSLLEISSDTQLDTEDTLSGTSPDAQLDTEDTLDSDSGGPRGP